MPSSATFLLLQRPDGSRLTAPPNIGIQYRDHALVEFFSLFDLFSTVTTKDNAKQLSNDDETAKNGVQFGRLPVPHDDDNDEKASDENSMLLPENGLLKMIFYDNTDKHTILTRHNLRRDGPLVVMGLHRKTAMQIAKRMISADLFEALALADKEEKDRSSNNKYIQNWIELNHKLKQRGENAQKYYFRYLHINTTLTQNKSATSRKRKNNHYQQQPSSKQYRKIKEFIINSSELVSPNLTSKAKEITSPANFAKTVQQSDENDEVKCVATYGIVSLQTTKQSSWLLTEFLDASNNVYRFSAYDKKKFRQQSSKNEKMKAEGITPAKNTLGLLMSNLAKLSQYDMVVDPFYGIGSLANSARDFFEHFFWDDDDERTSCSRKRGPVALGSDILFQQTRTGCRENMVVANVFHPSCWRKHEGVNDNDSWCDAIICDPPFGLRENIVDSKVSEPPREEGENHKRFTGTVDKDGKHQSQCYVQDHSPHMLLERVSKMIQPVLEMANDVLSQKKRVVYLFPVFRSQKILTKVDNKKSYLWVEPISDSQKDFESLWHLNEVEEFEVLRQFLPQHEDFQLISCKRSPCRSGSMARLIVVMEKK